MRLNELRDNPGATHARKRVGRGIGSGKGKTAGRGHKGQNSRSGVALKGFEGGQMPIHRRLPKRGFNNLFAKDSNTVNLGRVQSAIDKGTLDAKKPVTVEALLAAGVIRRALDGVRLLGDGEIKAKVAFEVTGASAGAVKAVEKAGGSVTIVEMPKRQAKPKEKPAKAPTKAEAKPAAPKKAETKPAAKKTAKTAAKKPAAKKAAAKKPAAKKPAKKDK
jgi:large subunit ribosomal protein L15